MAMTTITFTVSQEEENLEGDGLLHHNHCLFTIEARRASLTRSVRDHDHHSLPFPEEERMGDGHDHCFSLSQELWRGRVHDHLFVSRMEGRNLPKLGVCIVMATAPLLSQRMGEGRWP